MWRWLLIDYVEITTRNCIMIVHGTGDRNVDISYCGLIRPCHIGTEQICSGWVITKRDMGGVIFLDLRDREGVLQVVIDAAKVSAEEFNLTERLRMQSVICVKGKIRKRCLPFCYRFSAVWIFRRRKTMDIHSPSLYNAVSRGRAVSSDRSG